MVRGSYLVAGAGLFLIGAGLPACMAHGGSVPMAGHRNPSTACVLGLRGVRLAMEDAPGADAADAIDVRITMCSNVAALRTRARDFVARQNFIASEASPPDAKLHATAKVEDIDAGVRIRILPHKGEDNEELRATLEARVDELASQRNCY